MPITIVTTSGAADANSYASVAELQAWIDNRLHNSTTVTAARSVEDTLKKALVASCRYLDQLITWDGDPSDPDVQALQWPREDLEDDKGEDLDEDTIPQRIKDAQCELSCYLIDSDRTAENSSAGIADLQVGSVKIGFDTASPPERKVIPDAVLQMVALWGDPAYQGKSYILAERG